MGTTSLIPAMAIVATTAEIIFVLFLIIGFKTELFVKLNGFLSLLSVLSLTFSTGVKDVLDYSVYIARAEDFFFRSLVKNN